MLRVYDGYERRKQTRGKLDFEDMLGTRTCGCSTSTRRPPRRCARGSTPFTVDEFQDVNPLQAALLDRWLGDRDDLCVVGRRLPDDLRVHGRVARAPAAASRPVPGATVVRLEENYRSTPEVLEFANKLATVDGRVPTRRCGRRGQSGPTPVADRRRPTTGQRSTPSWRRSGKLHDEEQVPLEEIAVLYRINARSEPFEEAFAAAHIPYQVRDGAFLRPAGAALGAATAEASRRRRRRGASTRSPTSSATTPQAAPDAVEEVTRQADLGRLRALADGVHAGPSGRGRRRVRRGAVGRGSRSSATRAA